jgi:flagellar M-ring protein FliF
MDEFFKKTLENIKNIFSKLNQTQKLIMFGVGALIIVGFIFLISFSSKQTESLLFQSPLEQNDFMTITNKLTQWNADFKERDSQYIIVKDEDTSAYLRMRLGKAGVLTSGIKGWELFDTQAWTNR